MLPLQTQAQWLERQGAPGSCWPCRKVQEGPQARGQVPEPQSLPSLL